MPSAAAKDLQDGVWFITGASAGFGRALAKEVIGRGGRVAATARDATTLAALQSSASDRVLPLVLDVTKNEQIDAAVQAAERRFGQIDVLVNNAGYGFLSGMEEGSDSEARAQFDVNFFGLCSVTRAILPMMRRRRSGCIVNMSSVAGVFAMGGSAYYSATKFAVEALSEALAHEVAPFDIRVLIVEPGAFRTEFFGRSMVKPASPIVEYTELSAMRANLDKMDGAQPGDPELAARAIVDTVLSPSPPLRLLLGSGAFERARKALSARLEELDKNRTVALGVEFRGRSNDP
jgi:NAD(P)-dependent dehydrogenase (short-subunit alcohol dehydrogenase family)